MKNKNLNNNQPNTYDNWQFLNKNSSKWTSKNMHIDNFIQDA